MGENYQTLNDVDFMQKIELKNIEFSYDKKVLFEDFSFEVKKGEKLALIGESGSGKSTLVDIIMGIIKINKGNIIIDGKELIEDQIASWRQKFGYIPQSIYLFDGTVGENIAFGRDYDEAKIEGVLKQANILDFLNQKKGINTIVGEGGIQLSGGQKQRIGIARALYNNPEILVLDEATSALDNETENKIMQEIYSNCDNKTLIIIAHRLSTIGQCDRVIKIKNGKAEDE
jgi:ABC-type multidrug transport system fused ATPase/permease subunit